MNVSRMARTFVSVEDVCYKLGLDLVEQGSRLVGLCPLHFEEHPSFMVYPDTNSWFCFSCARGGTPLRLASLVIDDIRTWKDLVKWLGEERMALERVPTRATPSLDRVKSLFGSADVVTLPDAPLSSNKLLASLGVLYVREGDLAGRHIVPIILDGVLVAYEARDFIGQLVPKTLVAPRGVRVHSYLWNIDNVVSGSSVIVVEGTKAAIAVMEFGFPNVVSSFGARLSADQIVLLMSKKPSEVIIAYDADTAGIIGSSEAATNMLAWTGVYQVALPEGTDPWDVSEGVWKTCLKARKRVLIAHRNREILSGIRKLVHGP